MAPNGQLRPHLNLKADLWVVAEVLSFHLTISLLPESTLSDLQGEVWLTSHQILVFNLGWEGGLSLYRTLQLREMVVPGLVILW